MNQDYPSLAEAQVDALDKAFTALQDHVRRSPMRDISIELLAVFALKYICDTSEPARQGAGPRKCDWETIVHEGYGSALAGRLLKLTYEIESQVEPLRDVFTNGLLTDLQRWEPNLLHQIVSQLSTLSLTHVDDDGLPAFTRWFDMRLSTLLESGILIGEYATRFSLAELMVKLADLRPNLTVLDPCCGIGTVLTSAAQIMCTPGQPCGLYGQEINIRSWALCKLRLFLLPQSAEHIALGDALRQPAFFSDNGLVRFDRVLCDAPLGQKFPFEELERFDLYGRFQIAKNGRISTQSAFILHLISSLKNNGVGVVLVSHSFLFRSGTDARLREELIETGYIKAVIGLPGKLLAETPIETALILLEKNDWRRVLFVDAAMLQARVRGKAEISSETVQHICRLVGNQQEEEGVSHFASLEQLRETQYSLVPKHYVSAPKGSAQDVESLREQVPVWESEQHRVVEEMDHLLRDLGH